MTRVACTRVIYEKIGITVTVGRVLAIHHMFDEHHSDPQTGVSHISQEGVNVLFDCGTIPADTEFVLGGGVIGTRWFAPEELTEYLTPFTAQRTLAALRALEGGDVELLTGHPASV